METTAKDGVVPVATSNVKIKILLTDLRVTINTHPCKNSLGKERQKVSVKVDLQLLKYFRGKKQKRL